MSRSLLALAIAAALTLPALAADGAAPAAGADKPKSEFGALKFRNVGPAISGRTTRVAGVVGDRNTYYAAFSQGGVWKSDNGGTAWRPIFDDQPTNAIGAIAVADSDPNVLYVGSGEANIRGNVSFGSGIFKSTDAGKTWQHVWKARGQIGTVAIHPKNPDIAFAAVLGSPFGPSKERGVYRTEDGGKTWKAVLTRDEITGASDVAFDPNNPRVLFAGMWQARRQPWVATSGGPGSGLHRSDDGGTTWKQLKAGENGLPAGEWGKVGVRVAPSDSSRVYALIEAKEGGLYRSDDGGGNWQRVSDAPVLRQRAWYYTCLTIDPNNANIVYVPQVNLLRSIDGGKSFQSVKGPHHGDHHDIWIDPRDSKRVLSGNDGGMDLTVDGGATWFAPATSTAQFYNIDVDDRVPYHVGGTMQDWGTASFPAYTLRSGGPGLGDTHYVGGGEAGDFKYDPANPGHVYAGEYSGYLSHYQEGTGQFRNVSVYPRNFSGKGMEKATYRFQWTAPLALSPHDPKVLYHGAQVLFRSTDRGSSWTAISPDLTRNDKSKQQWSGGPITGDNTGVEVYDVIFSVAESPLAAGQIWVGTDDGLVQLTRDGGKSWSNVTPAKMPEWGTVESVEPSRKDAGTAYVAVDARRLNDVRPYLFRTRDYGRSWEQLGKGLPDDEHLFVVREDPTDANLLYVGSERGVYYSRDGGANFQTLRMNVPAVGVPDIEVKHDDLILGTRRGIWILDDLTSVRGLTPAVKNEAVHLFPPRGAHRFRQDYRWDQEGQGDNRPIGLSIDYWLKDKPKDPEAGKAPGPDDADQIKLEILDASGRLVRTLSSVPKPTRYAKDDPDQPQDDPKPALTREQGLNRVVWDLRYEGAKRLEKAKIDAGNPEAGPLVLPGKYTLRLTANGQTLTREAEVKPDPRSPVPIADTQQNLAFALELRGALNRLVDGIETVRAIRSQSEDLKSRTKGNARAAALQAAADAAIKRCDEIEAKLHNPKAAVVYDVLAGREGGAQLYSQISPLYSDIQTSDFAPTQGHRQQFAENMADLKALEGEVAALVGGEVAKLEAEANALKLGHVIVPGGG